MGTLDARLSPIVNAARRATVLEALCLGTSALAILALASMADGRSLVSPASFVVFALGAVAAAAAYLRAAWVSLPRVLRRADRLADNEERFSTQFSLLQNSEALEPVKALFLQCADRDTNSGPALGLRHFFRRGLLVPPMASAAAFAWFALAPMSPLRDSWQVGEAKRELAQAATMLESGDRKAGAELAARLREIAGALGTSATIPSATRERWDALHAQLLQTSERDGGRRPVLQVSQLSSEEQRIALAALEKARIAAPLSRSGAGGNGSLGEKVSGDLAGGKGKVLGALGEETPVVSAPAGNSAAHEGPRVSAAYSVPPQFEPVVRRYFQGTQR